MIRISNSLKNFGGVAVDDHLVLSRLTQARYSFLSALVVGNQGTWVAAGNNFCMPRITAD